MSQINTVAADYAQARNVLGENSIRFGLDYGWYSANRTAFFTVMDQHVAWDKSNHLWIIPVIFFFPGNPGGSAFNQLPAGGQDAFWNTTANQQTLVNFWQDFATHYANEPTIAGYDIFNEPGPPSLATYTSWCQSAYNAITAVDPNHFVVLESDGADGGGSLPAVTGTRMTAPSFEPRLCRSATRSPYTGRSASGGFSVPSVCCLSNGMARCGPLREIASSGFKATRWRSSANHRDWPPCR